MTLSANSLFSDFYEVELSDFLHVTHYNTYGSFEGFQPS